MHDASQQHREKSRELQRSLYRAAKRSRTRRFHALYDRIYRLDVLWRAWIEVRSNGGSAGIDGETIQAIQSSDVTAYLEQLRMQLQSKTYRPLPVKRVYIPKPDGSKRPLGIPCLRDRIVQQACKIVIEPLFEALFEDYSYGFRPKRSARDAVATVKHGLVDKWWVVDADIVGFFDNLNHDILESLIGRRISDRRVLKLIRQWLKIGVVEEGNRIRTDKGCPQGSPLSPLLANIYLHVLDRYWRLHCSHLGQLVRYCDDFVILCHYREDSKKAYKQVKAILQRLALRLHPEKSRLVEPYKTGFDFLGFHFRKSKGRRGKIRPLCWPSNKAMKKVRKQIRFQTAIRQRAQPLSVIVHRLNVLIRGWRQYFLYGNGTQRLTSLDFYTDRRLWLFYRGKMGKRVGKRMERFKRWIAKSGIQHFYQPGILSQPS